MLKRVLIANRGEIAVRVIRACKALSIETVAVYSHADRDAMHVQLADHAVGIGPSPAPRSYLNTGSLIAAAMYTKADAVHPGYGFLAENAMFAQACVDAGITFVGPSAQAIREMADKARARRVARAMGVPTADGYEGDSEDESVLLRAAESIGYPLLIKAVAGGGGRGMLRVDGPSTLAHSAALARSQAQSAFSDGRIYLERFVDNARHVEVQVLGDGRGGAMHLGERDCSIQRRHQKLLEEAPCAVITASTRAALFDAAVRLSSGVHYAGAGTVEFLVDLDRDAFYFIEMNTRIQVEHTVTEMLTGTDLVREQLLIAGNEGVSIDQRDVTFDGHAIECRINAEDSANDFRPTPGTITEFMPPQGANVRIDTHCRRGATVPPFYDSLIAKLIVKGHNRREAIKTMQNALSQFIVRGVPTTIDFHQSLLANDGFLQNRFNTRWLEDNVHVYARGGGAK